MTKKSALLLTGVLLTLASFNLLSARAIDGSRNSSLRGRSVDTIPEPDPDASFLFRSRSPYDLREPSIIEQEVEFDPETGQYILTEKIGEDYYRAPTYMTFNEYLQWKSEQQERQYFSRLAGISTGEGGASGLDDPLEQYTKDVNLVDRLFGGNEVSIQPQGNIDLFFGLRYSKTENPALPLRNQRQMPFDFDMDIRLNVTGQIGKKLSLSTNYNTQSQFDFENQLKLKFDSEQFSEDDILKNIEAGNVSLPLRSNLIQGSQSLFGIKTELQFGYLRLTAIASQQKSRQKSITVQGGNQVQYFEVRVDDYDENRHFFITHFNRETYEDALTNLPQVNSLFKINRIEVWRTNIQNETERLRDIVAIADLAEPNRFVTKNAEEFIIQNHPANLKDITGRQVLPDNSANKLFERITTDPSAQRSATAIPTLSVQYGLETGRDFEVKRAQRLQQNEYTLNEQLGVLSLNTPLRQEEVLAVAVEYDYNGKTYRIGQFANESESDSTKVLFVKMLKTATPDVRNALWDLMMKNVYNIGAYQVDASTFNLDVFYDDPGAGFKRFLPEPGELGRPLLQLFNLDQLNALGDPQSDGRFDFVPGVTINPRTGKVLFPVLEPFGSSLEKALNDVETYERYEYEELYDSTKFVATEYQEKNRFLLKGKFESSVTSEISLGAFNIPEGSVTVSAGGKVLQEGVDFEVDYNIGRLRILNESYLASGVPININFEDNSLFSFQNRNLVGLRADYELSDNITLGGTYLHLWEQPITQKVNIGDDPINNRIFGLDASYTGEAPWLTKVVDALPGIETKAPSSISAYVEGAALIPGYSDAINLSADDAGSVYIDDFEGTAARIDISQPLDQWTLASIPQGDARSPSLFPESTLSDNQLTGVNRALVNWYRIERGVTGSSAYTRIVNQNEIFPQRTLQPGLNTFRPLDITYYPREKGPYNYDVPGGTENYSAGVDDNGNLLDPQSRWGGIMRGLNINDFQSSNIEYIEFWMLNPFIADSANARPAQGGHMYIELGNISEDILKDGRAAYENGLPRPGQRAALDTTNWGVVPQQVPFVNAFDNDPDVRAVQDVGLDGMSDSTENIFLKDYVDEMAAAGINVSDDPANDNFEHFLSESFTNSNVPLLERYKRFNHPDGNSPNSTGSQFTTSFTFLPSTEDINRDFTSDRIEGYFRYKIPLFQDPGNRFRLQLNDYITDTIQGRGDNSNEIWYRFVVPIQEFTDKVGSIQDFRSIRFMRMYWHGFDEQVTMRFATLDLVRNSWRRFLRNNLLSEAGPCVSCPPVNTTTFSINSVGLEENSKKIPYNYVLPPGITREQNFQATNQNQFLNESSLAMEICDLQDGDARAVFRNDQRDLRLYERLKMFVHAESNEILAPGDLSIFIRMGSDYTENYYEYEIPLTMSQDIGTSRTDPGVIWPKINEFDFALQELIDIKKERNAGSFANNKVYIRSAQQNGNHTVKVKGNPNLGFVKGFMIGIRNKDDGKGSVCVEVWTNELRVTGLDRRGGMAGLGRLDMQLADFGIVSFSGSTSTIGWGGISQSLNERARESVLQYDVSTNLQLGKLLGENSPLRLPFYAQISNTRKKPQFDPYDLDIKLNEKLDATPSKAARDSIVELATDKTSITSINFTNVKIEPRRGQGGGGGGIRPTGGAGAPVGGQRGGSGGRTPLPWDIENFSLSYAYTETDHSDPIIELDNTQNHTASLEYSYSYNPLYIEPFKNLIKNDKYLKFIKELHLNPLPNSFGASTLVDRYINTRRYRFSNPKFSTWYDRRFTWDRTYNLRWDLTRSLRLNFTATHLALVDELDQYGVDFKGDTVAVSPDTYRWNNVKDFGRPKNYNHSIALSWNVPLRNFPFLDFVDVRAQTTSNYGWSAAPVNIDSLGNVIQNGQQRQVNATLNFERLYNKSGYLRSLNQKSTRRQVGSRSRRGNQSNDKGSSGPSVAEQILVRPLLILRKAQFNWQEGFTNTVPGFLPQAELLGMSSGFSAPGWEYALGFQPEQEWLFKGAREEGWFTASRFLSQEVINSYSNQWNGELTLEPWNDFRIDVSIKSSFQNTSTALFKNDSVAVPDPYTDYQLANYVYSPRNEFGSYTISYLALNTLFRDGDDQLVALFNQFESNRSVISSRLNPDGPPRPNDPSFKEGYGRKQQNVLIPAFISAYTDTDPQNVNLDIFDTQPLPNWNIQYNGLSRIPFFQKMFRSVRISHGYQGSMTVNSFQRNAAYDTDEDGIPERDEQMNFYSRFVIPEVVIDERFSPLLGIDVQTQNDMQINFQMNRARRLSLSFTDTKLFETKSVEYTFGFGYTLDDVNIGFLNFGKKNRRSRNEPRSRNTQGQQRGATQQGNELTITMNFSYSDNVTFAYELDTESELVPTRGLESIRINPSAEYDVNKNLTLQLFVDYNRTIPRTSLSFPVTNARGGLKVRFNLN